MDKASEEWRLVCELRYVVNLPEHRRMEFYQGVKKHRGEEAARVLVDRVNQYRREAR